MQSIRSFMRLWPLATLLAVGFAGAAAPAPDMVAQATMVIGVARLISADGVSQSVDRGTAVRVGDRIETGAGGHVHLRFVDGARLSVRPLSRLQIENYSRSDEQSALTAIKFRLDEGVVRSITGAWGEAARDRFRLNTPVAAIGVKGTDFVVKSDANNTLASVYTGAIMLTPLSPACRASLGPCLNGSERLLSEDMKGQMLSLDRLQASPQLVPAIDLLAQRAQPVVVAELAPRPERSIKAEPARSETTVEKAVFSESRAVEAVAVQVAAATPVAVTPAPVVVTPAPVVVTPVPVVVAPVPVVLPAPVVSQLVWSRLAAVAADGDTISRSFAQASQGGRVGTVGNFAYTLMRDAPGSAGAVLVSADSSANFRLAGSAAQLIWSDRGTDVSDAVRVEKASLSVDFARSTYATSLSLASARIGSDSLVSSGVVSSAGLLQQQSGNALVAGAMSLDGKEAGYFFEKSLGATGQLRGITLWGR